jgi:hypothetical protein
MLRVRLDWAVAMFPEERVPVRCGSVLVPGQRRFAIFHYFSPFDDVRRQARALASA